MNKKMSKRQKDIKSKLMAAIAMLLVSSIMMVSTTYAWFTLSTAPEVTGISTAVGANGNLEMALLPVNGNNIAQNLDYGVTTGTEDSMATQAANLANVTWGNLVDLTNYYGLENITLYPSAVNGTFVKDTEDKDTIVPATIAVDGSILKTPLYGADGRISELKANTISGIYDTDDQKAYAKVMDGANEVNNPAGVRLIGTSSGISPRQLDFRNALSAASTASTQAQTAARNALEANGGGLGNIAVKYATEKTNYDAADKAVLVNMVNALKGTGNAKGALDYIEDGIRQYIYAYQISQRTDYTTVRDKILGNPTANPAVTASALSVLDNDGLIPDEMDAMITALNSSRDAVDTASEKLAELEDSEITWSTLSSAMSSLVNIYKMEINGVKVADESGAITSGLKEKIMGDFIDQKGITLTMPSGSGVFADISDFTGDYGAVIAVPAKEVIGVDKDIPASMAAVAKDPTWFESAKATASKTPIQSEQGATEAITDYYGYVIDLAFKTNASGSKLQLQTDAVDRYSTESTDEATMGHGATMIFTSNDANFQQTDMVDLMKSIRVVFFDPTNNNTVLGFGVPAGKVEPLGGGEVSVGLKFARSPLATQDAQGNDQYDLVENNAIMTLEQNKAHRLSVLVYLDGNTVTNADVAVGADKSMTGRLNLQFSSDANLKPMKYTDFQTGEETPTPGQPTASTTEIATSNVNVTGEGYSATEAYFAASTEGNAIGVKLAKDGAAVTEGVTVTINNASATYSSVAGAWVAATTETEAPASVTVAVTPADNG